MTREPSGPLAHLWILAVDPGDVHGIHQRGLHRPGHHDRHPDAVTGEIEPQHLRQTAQTVLARRVGGMPGQSDQPGRRRHVHQVPAAARLDHGRHEILDDVDRAHQVDVDHRLPVPVGQLVHRAPGRHTGDVHHHVHRGPTGVDVRRERGDLVDVGDVEHAVSCHHRPQRAGVGDRRGQPLGVAVGQVELRTLDSQPQRGRTADPARRAGQEAALPRKTGAESGFRAALLRHDSRPYRRPTISSSRRHGPTGRTATTAGRSPRHAKGPDRDRRKHCRGTGSSTSPRSGSAPTPGCPVTPAARRCPD